MISEVSGDILLSSTQAIAHGVAPNDHFSSGLALALRERWPAMYKDFRHYCQNHHVEHVNHALRELHKLVLKEKFTSLALPRLATGVGGLDWPPVRALIETHLGSLDIPVSVYVTYQPGVKAAE